MGIRVGQEIDVQLDKRYMQHQRGYSIGDVYDALVELVTNADDSYSRLFRRKKRNRDGGDILVECCEQRRGQPSYVVVRDKAEGMDDNDMQRCLLKPGSYSSEEGDRGYMGRGAKECTELGDLCFESVKGDRYYKARLSHNLKFVLQEISKATKEKRKRLGLVKGNGTTVSIELLPNVPLPRLNNLLSDLPWHYALRDIMAEGSDSRVLLRKLGDRSARPEPLVYHHPEGALVVDETFVVPGFEEAKANLRIWRAPEPFDNVKRGPRFEKAGVLVKGERAIHEVTLIADEFQRDPHARRFFGRLECPYMDRLMAEYEETRSKGAEHPPENPRLLLDPNRRHGLDRRHPFVKALFQVPSERLRALIAKEKEREKSEKHEIANKETRNRLSRLARLAGRFLQEQLEDLEELGGGEAVDDGSFVKNGVLIYPTYGRVGVNNERVFTVYVKRSILADDTDPVHIECDAPDSLHVLGSPFQLHSHKTKEDRLLGSFKVKGMRAKANVLLTARSNTLHSAEALVDVVEGAVHERDFEETLEFDRKESKVPQGSRRRLRLFAKSPDLVAQPTLAKVTSSDPNKVTVRGTCELRPVDNSNFAEGAVTVEGRVLKARETITAEVNGRTASTRVSVTDSAEDRKGIPLEIDFEDKDYVNVRARWAEADGKPNLLLISARDKSVRRYLGAKEPYPGQNSPVFRVLLAEIVAESVCYKSLKLEAKERPWDFTWADMKQSDIIAEDVRVRMQQRIRQFAADAHEIMLSESDLQAVDSALAR